MSMNGGYKILDFKDQNITAAEGGTVAGIFEEIEASHRKAILVSGVTIDGVEQRDTFVDPVVNAGSYTFTAYGKTFTITSEDKITIA